MDHSSKPTTQYFQTTETNKERYDNIPSPPKRMRYLEGSQLPLPKELTFQFQLPTDFLRNRGFFEKKEITFYGLFSDTKLQVLHVLVTLAWLAVLV